MSKPPEGFQDFPGLQLNDNGEAEGFSFSQRRRKTKSNSQNF